MNTPGIALTAERMMLSKGLRSILSLGNIFLGNETFLLDDLQDRLHRHGAHVFRDYEVIFISLFFSSSTSFPSDIMNVLCWKNTQLIHWPTL